MMGNSADGEGEPVAGARSADKYFQNPLLIEAHPVGEDVEQCAERAAEEVEASADGELMAPSDAEAQSEGDTSPEE